MGAIRADVGQAGPDEAPAGADAIAQAATFYRARADVAILRLEGAVAGVFDDDRIAFARNPVSREIEGVVDVSAGIGGIHLPDAHAGRRLPFQDGRRLQVLRDGCDVGKIHPRYPP